VIWLFETDNPAIIADDHFAATTALIVAGVLAAGSQIASSAIASHASQSAAQQQQQAAQKDLSLRQAVFNTQQQNLAPYRAIGLQGLAGASNIAAQSPSMDPSGNGWSTLRNPNAGPAGTPPVPNYSTFLQQPPPVGGPDPTWASQRVAPPGAQPTGQAIPRGTATLAQPNGALPPLGGQGGQGGMVTMRSPDGTETQQVPANTVSVWLQRGATVVG
jgi:hypothetical protein